MSLQLQFLYRIQPVRPDMLLDGPTANEAEIISRHFEYLQKLTEQSVVLLAGRTLNTDSSSFGIVIFTADTEEDARQLMMNDPAVKEKIMSAELFPYKIALMSESQV